LEGVISQQLLPKVGGGRALALEMLICTPAIRALIRDEKVHQIYSLIQAGHKYGMQTMNQALMELCQSGEVAMNDVLQFSSKPDELKEMLSCASGEIAGKDANAWKAREQKSYVD
jgi:twitching motility protein PilT